MNYFVLTVVCTLFGLHLVLCDKEEESKKCITLGKEATEIEKGINVTFRFLRTPEEYKGIADKCQETIECIVKVDPAAEQKFKDSFGMCYFYMFYNRDFASCANKLIAKKDDKIHCLDYLFNDYEEPDVDECVQWDSLQACIKEEIDRTCGQKTDEWVKQAAVFRKAMCDNPSQ